MKKFEMFLKITLICGLILFLFESASFFIFKDIYRSYLGNFLKIGSPLFFGMKLLLIDFLVSFLIIVIFDSIYVALPGGFLRKGINFAFILWALQTVPFVLHFLISTKFIKDLFWIILLKYLIIETFIAFLITGIYEEFYLKKLINEKEKFAIDKEKEGEKGNENDKNNFIN